MSVSPDFNPMIAKDPPVIKKKILLVSVSHFAIGVMQRLHGVHRLCRDAHEHCRAAMRGATGYTSHSNLMSVTPRGAGFEIRIKDDVTFVPYWISYLYFRKFNGLFLRLDTIGAPMPAIY